MIQNNSKTKTGKNKGGKIKKNNGNDRNSEGRIQKKNNVCRNKANVTMKMKIAVEQSPSNTPFTPKLKHV